MGSNSYGPHSTVTSLKWNFCYRQWPFNLWPCWRISSITPPIICWLQSKTVIISNFKRPNDAWGTRKFEKTERLLYHSVVASSLYLRKSNKSNQNSRQTYNAKEDNWIRNLPSFVNLLIAVSVSTDNWRSWLPAFPRNWKQTKTITNNPFWVIWWVANISTTLLSNWQNINKG